MRPDGLEVAQVDIDYALPDVLRGQIKSATVTGAALAIDLDAPSGGGDPFEIDLAPLESTGAALTLESALITVTGGLVGTLEIEIDAQADFSQDQAPMALSVEARADNNTLKLDRFTYTAERVFEGDERLTFAGNLDAALAHWHLSGWTLSDTDYAGGLNLSGTGTELAYTVLAPLSLRIDQSTEDDDASLGAEAALSAELTGRFDWGQNLRVPVHSIPSLTLLAERSSGGDFMRADIETGQVTLTSADDDAPDGTYAAKAEEVAFDLISGGATAKGTDTRATGAFEKIEATASLVETLGGSMRLIGGALTLPGYDIDLSGVTATLPFTAQGIDGAAEVSGLATHAIDDPAFAPLRISASLSQNADGLAFTGTGQPRGADASLSFNGGYAFAEGTTRLDFGPDTITFEPKGLQPADISRIFGDLKNVKGDIVLEGDWVLPAKGAAASQAQITFDGVDGDYYIVTAAGIEGTLALVDFTNPKTALPQTLTARAIKAPLPLEAPSVTFEVLSTLTDPAVRIGLAEGTLADGRVFVADTAIAIGSDAQDVTVEVERHRP